MPYRESKEQSAEILRLVLHHMGKHQAAYHPLSYAVWYEHVGGLNPLLTRALEKRLSANVPLIEADIRRFHALYLAARDAQEAEKVQREFELLLDGSSKTTEDASRALRVFEAAAQARVQELSQASPGPEIHRIANQLLEDIRQVREVTMTLAETLGHHTTQIESLRVRASRAHADPEALTDALSGLKNRRGFERALQGDDENVSLAGASFMILDIDHFKQINDRHGHLMGDKVIRSVAGILRESTKGRDIAVRLGGDELAAFLPDTPLLGAMALAEYVRSKVQSLRIRRTESGAEVGKVTVSIGVAAAQPSDTLERLLDRADRALYAAKQAGRDRVCQAVEK